MAVLALYGRLLDPGAFLTFRDLPLFHLPLRTALTQILQAGELPLWNSMLNGGQPILSNPNYSAFYPPTWLALVVGPAYSLNLGIVLHATLGCAGAVILVRRLGGAPGAGALAALAWAGGGIFLSTASSYTLFATLAWWPWVIAAGIELFEAPRWGRPAVLLALALALEFLAGEPVTLLLTILPLTALALIRSRPWDGALRLAAAGALALLLGSVQLVPTVIRVTMTERSAASFESESLGWSAPPERFLEMALPRLFGDPMRLEEDLYFGWRIHDQGFPYVPSIYPGLLLVVLGLAALLRPGIPYRGAWGLTLVVGAAVALGRHNPALAAAWNQVPILSWIRFPERFLVVVVLVITLAGILGWQRLLTVCRQGARRVVDLSLALATGLLLIFASLAVLLHRSAALGSSFVAHYGPPNPPMTGERLQAGVAYLQQQSLVAVAVAAGVVGLMALLRWGWGPRWLPGILAPLLLALDLGYYSQGLLPIGPVQSVLDPPASLQEVVASADRIFTDADLHRTQDFRLRNDAEAGFQHLRLQVERGDPYLANLWGLSYIANADYDRMLTRWGLHSRQILEEEWWRNRDLAYRLLGAWGVERMLLWRSPEELARVRLGDPDAPPLRIEVNRYRLPPVRSVPVVEWHRDLEGALGAARASEYTFPWRDYFVAPEEPEATAAYGVGPRFLRYSEGRNQVSLHSRADGGLLVAVAVTFDPGWRAAVVRSSTVPAGQPVPLFATAAGQIGLRLPAGEHQVTLRYHQPGLRAGAILTLLGLTVVVAAAVAALRRR